MLLHIGKKEKGSLTVEAALVLPVVIITLLFTINILNIYLVHTCMQQALNNTAKKLSQDSYLVYRFAGEENYAEYINGLQNVDTAYSAVAGKVSKAIEDFHTTESSVKDVIDAAGTLSHTFDDYSELGILNKILNVGNVLRDFGKNIEQLLSKADETKNNAKTVWDDIIDIKNDGAKYIKEIIIKSLVDVSGSMVSGTIVSFLFNNYIDDLNVSAGAIEEFNPFQTKLNPDGSFTMCITYKYKNPFSFINNESFEYSLINRNIRMMQTITVKPFVGKNGTSLIEKPDAEQEIKESEETKEVVYIVSGINKIVYHNDYMCPALTSASEYEGKKHIEKELSYVTSKPDEYRICEKCKDSECLGGIVYIKPKIDKVIYHTNAECRYCNDNKVEIDKEKVINSDLFALCSECAKN